MARPPALKFSDFESDDQLALKQTAPSPTSTLLDWAKTHGLRVTSGFSKGGHNSGSRHYHGSESDPGAIDIDHRNVDHKQLLSWANQNGYTVLDERSRPAGQAVWGGPHFHIQKGGKPSGKSVAKTRELPASQPKAAASQPIVLGNVDLTMPVTTDAQGNLVFNQQKENKVDLSKALKPVQQKRVADTPGLPDFELDANDMAEIKAIRERLKAKPKATPQPQPKEPSFVEGVGNLIKAGGQMLQQVPGAVQGAFQKEFETHQKNPLLYTQDLMGSAVVGGLSSPTDIVNMVTQTPAAIGNAFAGREKYKPLLPEIYGARDIPGLKEMVERHPVGDFTGGAAIPLEGALWALAKGRNVGKVAKAAGKIELPSSPSGAAVKNYNIPEALPQPTLPEGHKPQYGFVNQNGELIQPRHQVSPENVMQPGPVQPGKTRELSEAFAARQRPSETPQIIDPRNAPIPKELGSIKTEELPSGLIVASRAGETIQKPSVDIQAANGLPSGRSLTPENTINPVTGRPYDLEVGKSAQDSFSAFDEAGRAKYAVDAQNKEALNRYQANVQTVKEMGGSDDLATAQRNVGARINELEQKPNLTDAEYAELSSKVDTLDSLLKSRERAVQTEKQLADSQKLTSRESLPEPDLQGRSVDVTPSRPPSAQEGPVFRDIDSAVKPEPSTAPRINENPASGALNNVREIGTPKPEILDATGKPVSGKAGNMRELEIPGQPKPSNAQLELPRPFEAPKVRELPTGGAVDMVPGTSKMKELVQNNQMPVPKAGEINKAINDLPTSDQPINPAKPRTVETTQAAQSQGIELMNVADAHEFVKKYQPDQLSHFGNILEAAKNNQTVSVKHKPLDGGGRVENAREIHPVDFGKKTIQGKTEVGNLLKEFADGQPNEAAYAAVRDNLVQRLAKNNIQVSAKEQNITGGTPLAIKRKLNALANRLPEHERTHVYVMDHNLDSTARGQSYGFRRIDRVTESGLTGKQQAVPEVSQYQNKVKPAFDAMRQMAESPDTPTEVSKAIKNITDKGKVNRKDAALMKEWLKNNYSTFCKLFELE